MIVSSELGTILKEIELLNSALRRIKHKLLLRSVKASRTNGYNEDEPCDWHGRWTTVAQLNDPRVLSDADPDPIIPWAEYAGDGHHYVTRHVFNNPKYSFSAEAIAVFEGEKTGPLNVPESNYFDHMHRQYNIAVEESLDKFLTDNKIDPKVMTTEQAKAFVSQVKASRDVRIRRFNMRLWLRESMYWLRRGVRGRE